MIKELTLDDRSPASDAPTASDLAAAFEGCRKRGYLLALHITGDAEDAADLVQEAYLRASRRLDRFRGEARLETWLLRIVVNLALKHVRRRKRRQRFQHLLPLPQSPPSSEWLAGCSEQLRKLAAALDLLPAQQRAVFVLRYAQDLPLAEVADLLDISIPTVKTHLMRGVERLRRALKRMER